MRFARRVPVALLAACALSGCATRETGAGPLAGPAPPDLPGSRWDLTTLGASGPPRIPITPTLDLSLDGRVSGTTGCNRYMGPVTIGEDESLAVGPVASTKRACGKPTDGVERAFLTALGSARRVSVEEPELRLLDAGGDAVATFRRASWLAFGNEPFWSVRLAPDGITLTRPEDPARPGEGTLSFPWVAPRAAPDGRAFVTSSGSRSLTVTLADEPCTDTMSGARTALTAVVELDAKRLAGCAKRGLEPPGEPR